METEMIKKILIQYKKEEITLEEAINLMSFTLRYSWLKSDVLQFALALQEENRLTAIKWLSNEIKEYTLTPFKTAKEILDCFI